MKPVLIILVLAASTFAHAYSQQAFSSISINKTENRNVINFTLPREVNINHYRVEAGNDSLNFEVIATIPSKGNDVLARNYSYDLAGYTYRYYRIGIVRMNGSLSYSQIVFEKKDPANQNFKIEPKNMSCNTIVNK